MEPEIVIKHDVCSDENSNNVLMHTQVKHTHTHKESARISTFIQMKLINPKPYSMTLLAPLVLKARS